MHTPRVRDRHDPRGSRSSVAWLLKYIYIRIPTRSIFATTPAYLRSLTSLIITTLTIKLYIINNNTKNKTTKTWRLYVGLRLHSQRSAEALYHCAVITGERTSSERRAQPNPHISGNRGLTLSLWQALQPHTITQTAILFLTLFSVATYLIALSSAPLLILGRYLYTSVYSYYVCHYRHCIVCLATFLTSPTKLNHHGSVIANPFFSR